MKKVVFILLILIILTAIGLGIFFFLKKQSVGKIRAIIPTPTPVKPALLQVLDTIKDDGTFDKDTALKAYSLTVGDMPGVTPPTGPDFTVKDVSGPLRWVLGHYDELTPEQKAAVDETLKHEPMTQSYQWDPLTVYAAPFTDDDVKKFKHMADISEQNIAGNIGHGLDIPYSVNIYDHTKKKGKEKKDLGYTVVTNKDGGYTGKPAWCFIYISDVEIGNDTEAENTMIHEMLHCFQGAAFIDLAKFYKIVPSWLIEGSAEYAGDFLTSSADPGWWRVYLTQPQTSLFKRTYDAMGFFSHMQEAGIDPWKRFDFMFDAAETGGYMAAFNEGITGHVDEFFKTWATGYARDYTIGPEWDTKGPAITSDTYKPPYVTINNGDSDGGHVSSVSNALYYLALDSEVSILSTPQYARLHDYPGSGYEATEPRGVFCTKKGGCVCPKGSAHEGETFTNIPQQHILAVTGGTGGADWLVSGMSLENYCKSQKMDACLVGTWTEQRIIPAVDTHGLIQIPDPIGLKFVFQKDGSYSVNFDTFPPLKTKDGDTVTFSGAITGKMTTIGGTAVATNDIVMDNLYEHLTMDGMQFPPISATTVLSAFGLLDKLHGSGTYKCSGDIMTFSSGGRTATFKRE